MCVSQIALRNKKSIELRVGGSVEPPNVDISVVSFSMCVCVYVDMFKQIFFCRGVMKIEVKPANKKEKNKRMKWLNFKNDTIQH